MKTTVWTSYLTSKLKVRQSSKLACLLTFTIILVTLGILADDNDDTKTDLDPNVSGNMDSVARASADIAKSETSQKNLARIVAILRFEARLAVQEAARERTIAEQEAGLSTYDVAKERSKERYEGELAMRETAKERAKERYEGELATREVAKERAKERYEAELAAQEAAKKRAKERYDAEISTQDTAQERAKERYEGEITTQAAAKERAKERYEGELARQEVAKERAMARIAKASEFDENALKEAVFGAIDSNNDDELSRAEFETGVQILDTLWRQNYPGMKEIETSAIEVEEKSDGSDEFAKLDADEDGVLSQSEFDEIVGRFL